MSDTPAPSKRITYQFDVVEVPLPAEQAHAYRLAWNVIIELLCKAESANVAENVPG